MRQEDEQTEENYTRMVSNADSVDSLTAPVNEATSALVKKLIVHGIEFFRIGDEEDCQCARCGSSCYFVDCANCGGEGEIEDEDWQFEGEFYRCDWCMGKGGWWRCCSTKEYCTANPMPGREEQPVMANAAGEID